MGGYSLFLQMIQRNAKWEAENKELLHIPHPPKNKGMILNRLMLWKIEARLLGNFGRQCRKCFSVTPTSV